MGMPSLVWYTKIESGNHREIEYAGGRTETALDTLNSCDTNWPNCLTPEKEEKAFYIRFYLLAHVMRVGVNGIETRTSLQAYVDDPTNNRNLNEIRYINEHSKIFELTYVWARA